MEKNVREQVSIGGGKLFKFISKLDKQYLQVACDTHSKTGNPEGFINEQRDLWASYWCPDDEFENDTTLPMEYKYLREDALSCGKHICFDSKSLDFALKGYKKETMGIDI